MCEWTSFGPSWVHFAWFTSGTKIWDAPYFDNPNLAAFRYLHWDHLGSNLAEPSTSSAVMHKQGYYAFGACRDVDAGDGKRDTISTDHKFTGQKLDGSGLMYYACPELAEGTPATTTRPWRCAPTS